LKRSPEGSEKAAAALMQLAWSSKAALSIAPLQDLLHLGAESRMNVPGRAGGNWGWRFTEEELSAGAFQWLRELTQVSKRSAPGITVQQEALERDDSVPAVPFPV
jgi:4-alpha-glucanotransferase